MGDYADFLSKVDPASIGGIIIVGFGLMVMVMYVKKWFS